SVIESLNFGIRSELLVTVVQEAPLELWQLMLENRTRRTRTLNLYSFMEWGLGQSPDSHREFHKSFIETSFESESGAILAKKRLWEVPTDRGHWNTEWPYVAFHSASRRPASYDSDKETFLGMYGRKADPAGVHGKTLRRRSGSWLDACASLHHRITLGPGERATIVYTLGCADSAESARTLASRHGSEEAVQNAMASTRKMWDRVLESSTVTTPDASMDLMQNIWLKYQAISCRMWGRTAYYQTGGAFGFRDQLQDSQIFLPIDPEQTKKQLLLHARHQFADGTVYHWWHPMSEIGLHNKISDNLLWLPYVLTGYIQETGDLSGLKATAPFVDDPAEASLYNHCLRAIDKALGRFSSRGLPLIGDGDWNDGLSAVGVEGKGESVWLGHFLHRILLDFAPIARLAGDNAGAERFESRAALLKEKLNTLAWDGEYYYGATKDSGDKLGSRSNAEGSLWLNPQTWAIISGVADTDRAVKVFDAVERSLECNIGPLLLHPAYSTPDKYIGYLTRYSPGLRENGGVYTHGATWAVVAAALLGRGKSAHRIYSKLNPINRGLSPDVYVAEPYVTAGNIEGPESPFRGRGGWTWYSGSAAWLFKVGLEYILGVRPSLEGLYVDPCIPSDWDGFSVERTFRGAVYKIAVSNPDHVECGVKALGVDGMPSARAAGGRGVLLPVFPAGSVHEIRIIMGP
ncbi:MAG TPA: glycosyl transferase family 36, partial [Bacteroidota bacterium]|nr:glycosyl transferase family 36 [Bacteroidota bacterium]